MNKILISFIIIFTFFSNTAISKTKSKDLVDLHKNHKNYQATRKIIDQFQIISAFPDHTFRGNKLVNRYEFAVISYKCIKYMEKKHKVSYANTPKAKNLNFTDLPDKHWAYKTISELKNSYGINFNIKTTLPSVFQGEKLLDKYELAFILDQLIKMFTKETLPNKNPYEEKKSDKSANNENVDNQKKASESLTDLISLKIISDESFNKNENINRYQISEILVKSINFTNKRVKYLKKNPQKIEKSGEN